MPTFRRARSVNMAVCPGSAAASISESEETSWRP
jgi:hypothetical protein